MKRFATLVFLAVAITVVAAATSAHAGGSATSADPVTVVTKFPAAGQLVDGVNSVTARRKPALNAKAVKVMKMFRPDFRKQEFLAVGETTAPNGTPWYRIEVPMRPNQTYGWIPASAVDLKPTVAQIVINRANRTIDVFRNGKHKLHAKVAVGAPGMETPLGKYYVAATFVPQNDPFLGVYALETSAYSKLTEWPGGGVVGIHGTNMPQLLGQAVSHGCVRVSNATASALKRLTPLGTPILIKAG
jgi:lipoprotein-anchoring transpeptidase ErfK/SrfK